MFHIIIPGCAKLDSLLEESQLTFFSLFISFDILFKGTVQFLHSFALAGSVGILTLIVRRRQVFPEAQKVDFY